MALLCAPAPRTRASAAPAAPQLSPPGFGLAPHPYVAELPLGLGAAGLAKPSLHGGPRLYMISGKVRGTHYGDGL